MKCNSLAFNMFSYNPIIDMYYTQRRGHFDMLSIKEICIFQPLPINQMLLGRQHFTGEGELVGEIASSHGL